MSNEEIDKILYTPEIKELMKKDYNSEVEESKKKKEDKIPCNNCQGGGCVVCSGTGFFIHT